MCQYWANFIKNGDPNGADADGVPLPCWKSYTEDNRFEMVFGRDGARGSVEEKNSFVGYLIRECGKAWRKQSQRGML